MKRHILFVATFLFGAATGFVLGTRYGKTRRNDISKKEMNHELTSWEDIRNEKKDELDDLIDNLFDIPPDDDSPDRLPFRMSSYSEIWNEYPDATDGSITYYKRDGVFIDELNEIIENPEEIIGIETIAYLESDTLTEDIIYIRNDSYDTNYTIEVERDKKYY